MKQSLPCDFMENWSCGTADEFPAPKKQQWARVLCARHGDSPSFLSPTPWKNNLKEQTSSRTKKILPYFAQTMKLPSCDSLQKHTKFQPKPVGRHFHPGISGILAGRRWWCRNAETLRRVKGATWSLAFTCNICGHLRMIQLNMLHVSASVLCNWTP